MPSRRVEKDRSELEQPIYDGNIFEWVGQRRTEFDRKTFREKCGDEGLLAMPEKSARMYGVKTFEHASDRLELVCQDTLNMLPAFDDRVLRDTEAWKTSLLPRLKEFLLGLPSEDGRLPTGDRCARHDRVRGRRDSRHEVWTCYGDRAAITGARHLVGQRPATLGSVAHLGL